MGAGLPANSLKCVGERGKEESVSSQQPRHLVEGPREDRDQITNTQPSASAEEGRGAGTVADNPCRPRRAQPGTGAAAHPAGLVPDPWPGKGPQKALRADLLLAQDQGWGLGPRTGLLWRQAGPAARTSAWEGPRRDTASLGRRGGVGVGVGRQAGWHECSCEGHTSPSRGYAGQWGAGARPDWRDRKDTWSAVSLCQAQALAPFC